MHSQHSPLHLPGVDLRGAGLHAVSVRGFRGGGGVSPRCHRAPAGKQALRRGRRGTGEPERLHAAEQRQE